MSKHDDGGQAFPGVNRSTTAGYWAGMTLRDYFAGQALAGFMANTKRPTTIHADDAAWAYTIADAMLRQRSK